MLLLSFILLVLFLAGLVGTGIQYFGSPSNVNGQCQRFVNNQVQSGANANTLAWLQQKNICECWLPAPPSLSRSLFPETSARFGWDVRGLLTSVPL